MALLLGELEQQLRSISHSEEAIQAVQAFSKGLAGTKARLEVWNAANAILRKPIEYGETAALGFDTPDDQFTVLQEDIVQTESAYFYGERIAGMPKFAVLNSSCDLVPGRTAHASLLRILPIRRDEERAKEKLGTLLKFSRRDSMYLPVLPDDSEDVVGNVISFEGICQIRSTDLFLARRVASLSVVGWRIFASFTRTVLARANSREVELRMAVET
ncbi:MAG TPA: hypothetical protein VI320_00005 [Terracidiphilus sp.]|jgi:hypothetical protein